MSAVVLLLSLITFAYAGSEPELDWKVLASIASISQKVPPALKPLIGKRVKVGGFIIVNEMNVGALTEFLMSPMARGCIHVPPPPPNYVIHVTVKEGSSVEYIPGPVMVHGVVSMASSPYYYYDMIADHLESYPVKR